MELILTAEEIENENSRIMLESNSIISLAAYPNTISANRIKDFVLSDTLPKEKIDVNILKNRNIRFISGQIQINKGLLINRTTLRYLPTTKTFYSSKIKEENVATELCYATPLLIMHKSLDNEWFYIQSYFCRGWVEKKNVLTINDSSFYDFLSPKKHIVITTPTHINDIYLDMGVKLPLLASHDTFYEVLFPGPNIAHIPVEVANVGYLPYTKENIIMQAKKYLNTPYRWGGIDGGVDCSLLIVNIFKTFGLLFPRDTSAQEGIIGIRNICLKGHTEEEKKEILATSPIPFILFKQGHVLLGIDCDTVLHAYGDAGKVFISKLDNTCETNLYPYLTSLSILYKEKRT